MDPEFSCTSDVEILYEDEPRKGFVGGSSCPICNSKVINLKEHLVAAHCFSYHEANLLVVGLWKERKALSRPLVTCCVCGNKVQNIIQHIKLKHDMEAGSADFKTCLLQSTRNREYLRKRWIVEDPNADSSVSSDEDGDAVEVLGNDQSKTTSAGFQFMWPEQKTIFLSSVVESFSCEQFTDISLRCGPYTIPCHRVVLSCASVMLEGSLKDPSVDVIIITEANIFIVRALLSYIYNGKVGVPMDALGHFLELAKSLGITSIKKSLWTRQLAGEPGCDVAFKNAGRIDTPPVSRSDPLKVTVGGSPNPPRDSKEFSPKELPICGPSNVAAGTGEGSDIPGGTGTSKTARDVDLNTSGSNTSAASDECVPNRARSMDPGLVDAADDGDDCQLVGIVQNRRVLCPVTSTPAIDTDEIVVLAGPPNKQARGDGPDVAPVTPPTLQKSCSENPVGEEETDCSSDVDSGLVTGVTDTEFLFATEELVRDLSSEELRNTARGGEITVCIGGSPCDVNNDINTLVSPTSRFSPLLSENGQQDSEEPGTASVEVKKAKNRRTGDLGSGPCGLAVTRGSVLFLEENVSSDCYSKGTKASDTAGLKMAVSGHAVENIDSQPSSPVRQWGSQGHDGVTSASPTTTEVTNYVCEKNELSNKTLLKIIKSQKTKKNKSGALNKRVDVLDGGVFKSPEGSECRNNGADSPDKTAGTAEANECVRDRKTKKAKGSGGQFKVVDVNGKLILKASGVNTVSESSDTDKRTADKSSVPETVKSVKDKKKKSTKQSNEQLKSIDIGGKFASVPSTDITATGDAVGNREGKVSVDKKSVSPCGIQTSLKSVPLEASKVKKRKHRKHDRKDGQLNVAVISDKSISSSGGDKTSSECSGNGSNRTAETIPIPKDSLKAKTTSKPTENKPGSQPGIIHSRDKVSSGGLQDKMVSKGSKRENDVTFNLFDFVKWKNSSKLGHSSDLARDNPGYKSVVLSSEGSLRDPKGNLEKSDLLTYKKSIKRKHDERSKSTSEQRHCKNVDALSGQRFNMEPSRGKEEVKAEKRCHTIPQKNPKKPMQTKDDVKELSVTAQNRDKAPTKYSKEGSSASVSCEVSLGSVELAPDGQENTNDHRTKQVTSDPYEFSCPSPIKRRFIEFQYCPKDRKVLLPLTVETQTDNCAKKPSLRQSSLKCDEPVPRSGSPAKSPTCSPKKPPKTTGETNAESTVNTTVGDRREIVPNVTRAEWKKYGIVSPKCVNVALRRFSADFEKLAKLFAVSDDKKKRGRPKKIVDSPEKGKSGELSVCGAVDVDSGSPVSPDHSARSKGGNQCHTTGAAELTPFDLSNIPQITTCVPEDSPGHASQNDHQTLSLQISECRTLTPSEIGE